MLTDIEFHSKNHSRVGHVRLSAAKQAPLPVSYHAPEVRENALKKKLTCWSRKVIRCQMGFTSGFISHTGSHKNACDSAFESKLTHL